MPPAVFDKTPPGEENGALDRAWPVPQRGNRMTAQGKRRIRGREFKATPWVTNANMNRKPQRGARIDRRRHKPRLVPIAPSGLGTFVWSLTQGDAALALGYRRVEPSVLQLSGDCGPPH
jgi:hypothetical protein